MPVCSVRAHLSVSPPSVSREGIRDGGRPLDNWQLAPLLSAQKLTAEWSDREVYEMTLDLGATDLAYCPGDSLDILPENDPDVVDRLIGRLNLNGTHCLTLEATEGTDTPLPHITRNKTLR